MGSEQKVRVLVVIVNYRSAQLTLTCLRSLVPERALPELDIKVVVVENDSGRRGGAGTRARRVRRVT